MGCTILVGGFFGDEGKGKIVAHIANTEKPCIIARGGVGPNAGHTVIVGDESYGIRMIPSGFVYKDARLLIGAGVLIDPGVFLDEVALVKAKKGRVAIDKRCSIIEKKHKDQDKGSSHLSKKIGSTGTGCGPGNAERVMRSAKQAKDIEELKEFLTDVPTEIDDALKSNNNVLIEGSQGFGISLYYGTYPYVTSKDTSASQIAADVGVGPSRVDEVIVVFKSFPTRVGSGPFETQISEEEAKSLGIEEFGTVTGRPRRIGMWDGKLARYSAMVNGATQIALTGLDRIDPTCKGVTDYDKLSDKAKDFVKKAEEDVGVPFTLLSTGPELSEIVDLRS